jgi:hypothetical protein
LKAGRLEGKKTGGLEGRKTGGQKDWRTGRLKGWTTGRPEDWKTGRMEGWKTGRQEDWKAGRRDDWKTGRLEDWKMGRLELCRRQGGQQQLGETGQQEDLTADWRRWREQLADNIRRRKDRNRGARRRATMAKAVGKILGSHRCYQL